MCHDRHWLGEGDFERVIIRWQKQYGSHVNGKIGSQASIRVRQGDEENIRAVSQ